MLNYVVFFILQSSLYSVYRPLGMLFKWLYAKPVSSHQNESRFRSNGTQVFVLSGFRSDGFSFYWDCILISRFVSFWLSALQHVTLKELLTVPQIPHHRWGLIRKSYAYGANEEVCNEMMCSATNAACRSPCCDRCRSVGETSSAVDTPALSHLSWRTWPCVVAAALFRDI